MKRLNPETGKPFARGDTRADGFLFWRYQNRLKPDGFFDEWWCSKEKFDLVFIKGRNCSAGLRKRNPEKHRVVNSRWAAKTENKAKVSAIKAKRRAAKLKRTPSWLTHKHLQQIENVYALAKQLTEETGIQHHVDHIVPLQGKTVSGLHVPWNLRAIPATENCSKGNLYES